VTERRRDVTRKLRTFQTSIGFFDLAIAAPSMKAALAAWGSNSNLFHQGFAKEVRDATVVAATMSKPGIVLRRPVGSQGPFEENADLPDGLPSGKPKAGSKGHSAKPRKRHGRTLDDSASRKAALAYEKQERQRDNAQRKEEAARAKLRKRQDQVVVKAEAAFEKARQAHEVRARHIEDARAAIEKRSRAEDTRWDKQKNKLEGILRRARR
jgi:colicin import membrane protein